MTTARSYVQQTREKVHVYLYAWIILLQFINGRERGENEYVRRVFDRRLAAAAAAFDFMLWGNNLIAVLFARTCNPFCAQYTNKFHMYTYHGKDKLFLCA